MPRRNQAVERGASLVEYGGVILLVAAIGVAVFGSGIPNQVFGLISDALACVGQEGDCSAEDSDQAAPDEESNPDPEGDPVSDTGGDPADPDSPVEVDPAPEVTGDWDDGVVTQTLELGDGVGDGVEDTACLAHLCDNDDFQDTWGDVGDTAFNADPAVWDGENGGPETSNVFFGFGDDDPELAPDPDASPEEVNDWWEGLDPGERAEVISEEPEHIRDLDGIPADVRDDLNQDFLEEETQRRLEEEGLTPEEAREIPNDADDELVELRELVKLEDTLNGEDGEEYFLLALDPDEERSIVSRGNPDTADNVSTMVPGTGITWEAMNGQLGRADRVHEAATAVDEEAEHASIAWIGYDTPSWPGAAFPRSAYRGQEELIGFQEGLRATHEGEPSNNTVIGHSYGSTLVGMSANGQPFPADNVIFTGSPGTTATTADDLSVDNVHATRSEDDETVGDFLAWTHGADATSDFYGAETFDTEPGTGHSEYFDDPQAEQMEYMGEVVAGER